MTHELQRYYEDRLDMMGSRAWLDLIDDIEAMICSVDTLSGVTTENLRFKQGELSILKWITSLSSISESAYQGLQNESNA